MRFRSDAQRRAVFANLGKNVSYSGLCLFSKSDESPFKGYDSIKNMMMIMEFIYRGLMI